MKSQFWFVGEMAKAAEPIIGKMNRRINALSVAALPAFLVGNQGEKALKWISQPFQF